MSQLPVFDRRRLLSSLSIFQGVTPQELEALLTITTTRKLRAGEVLFQKGDPGDQLYGVIRGRLRVATAGEDGKEVVFGFMEPGEIFGEIALLDAEPRSATVEAVDASELLTLHRRDLLPFLEAHPRIVIRLAGVLAARVRRASQLIEDTTLLPVPARLARKLLGLVPTYGAETPAGTRLDLKLSQQELGHMVGATRESVNKQLRSWVEDGIVALDHGRITIRRRQELESIARFGLF